MWYGLVKKHRHTSQNAKFRGENDGQPRHSGLFFCPHCQTNPTCTIFGPFFGGPNVASSWSQEVNDLKEQLKDAEAIKTSKNVWYWYTINLSMIRILSMITMTKCNTDFSENRHDSHYHISLGCPTSHFDIHSTPHVHGTGKGVWFGTGAEEDGGAGWRSRENPWNSWSMMNIP